MFNTAHRFLIRLTSVGIFAALLVAANPGDSNAQVTCGWCQSGPHIYIDGDGDAWLLNGHRFLYEGGGECLWEGHDQPATTCVRCGGSSDCHTWPQMPLWCDHILCGPAGDAMAAATEIRDALDTSDGSVVASALNRERAGVSVTFIPESGRIDVMLSCDLSKAVETIPVSAELREAIEATAEFQQR